MDQTKQTRLAELIELLIHYPYIEYIETKKYNHIKIYISSNINRRDFLSDICKYLNINPLDKMSPRSSIGGCIYKSIKIYIKHISNIDDLISLKPKDLNIVNKNYKLHNYVQEVKSSLKSISNGEISYFLTNIVDHFYKDKELSVSMFTADDFDITLPKNNIITEFGEVITPIGLISKNLISKGLISIPSSTHNPLYDLSIGNNLISVKSTSTTNTVKPKDIISLLNNKWKDDILYKSLEILSNNSAKNGPFEYVKFMSNHYSEFSGFDDINNIKNKIEPFIHSSLKNNDITESVIRYYTEYYIKKVTKDSINYTPLFYEAVKDNITYAYFDLKLNNKIANVSLSIVDLDNIKRIYLKSKNDSKNRCSDKLGFHFI